MSTEVTSPQSPADLKALVERGYDAIAPTYLAWSAPRPTPTRMEYIKQLIDLLPSGAHVLELGCGAGVPATQTLIEGGLDVTAVDISAAQIELARKHVPEATLVQGDMMTVSFHPESFDAVLGFYSIFHLPREEHGAMISRITGWLRNGGYLLCNLHTTYGDDVIDNWMGVKMFSSGLGVDGNRAMMKTDGAELRIIDDKVDVEKVGRNEANFHWIFAVKKR